MSLTVQIKDDIKSAMKAKQTQRRDALRLLASAIKQIEVDERRELNDSDIITIIVKQIKQRVDAASQYKDANRDDLYDKEMSEIKIYEEYLPKQLSDVELKEIVAKAITSTQASSMRDMGRVMSSIKDEIAGRADGKRASECIKKLLA